jgi:hypothetical protein
MAETTSIPTDAPLYVLIDARGEQDLFNIRVAFRDPKTGEIRKDFGLPSWPEPTPEEIRIVRAQRERLLELDPLADPDEILFHRSEYPLDPSLFETTRMLYGKSPKSLDHFARMYGISHWPVLGITSVGDIFRRAKELGLPENTERLIGRRWRDYRRIEYYVVSAAWREAVESVEPNVHDFLPLTLEFRTPKRVTSHSVFVMRTRTILLQRIPLKYELRFSNPSINPSSLPFDTAAIRNRHWFRTPDAEDSHDFFVSAALAQRLRPLLPNDVHLIPVNID